jgi:branched-chain amino acid aminotransferase
MSRPGPAKVVFRLEEHVTRLYKSAKAIMLDIPMGQEEMCRTVRDAVKADGTADGYIRLVVTHGVGDLGVNPLVCPKEEVRRVNEITCYQGMGYSCGLYSTR